MDFVFLLFIFFSCWLLIELLLWVLFSWLRSDFQWLIMDQDHMPLIDRKGLEKFSKKGMDAELGWVRKPHTNGQEKGRNGKKTQYTINKYGARHNPGFDDLTPTISLFGDSYAFGRQVNDEQTWSHFVSKKINKDILNFGVGNYGLDQAILRMEREVLKRNSELVIIAIVPETICRIQSVWKHYSEYGNTFAFKPRFILDKKKQLKLINNIINEKEKYFNYFKYIDEIRKYDLFYEKKFMKDILTFPYVYSFVKSIRRNGVLVPSLIKSKISKNFSIKDRPFQIILKNNHMISMSLYNEKNSLDLFEALIERADLVAKKNQSHLLFCLIPQLQDIELIKTHGKYYGDLLSRLALKYNTLDLTDSLMEKENVGKYYTHDLYGGHLSLQGNKLVADKIAKSVTKILNKGASK
jgi:hypothetical protein